MIILYCTFVGKSGGDVYFKQIQQTQAKLANTVINFSYHRCWSICPNLLSPWVKLPEHNQYDIIHSNIEYGYIFKRKNIPLVVSALHIINKYFLNKYYGLGQKIYYRNLLKSIRHTIEKADYIIAISKSTGVMIQEITPVKNLQIIYCGIDTEFFKPRIIENMQYQDKIKLLYIGNLTRRKGVDLLPKIMEKLDDRFILFYTTGLRTVKRVFANRRMIPIGRLETDELVRWYNLCDICLLPTRLEGFGYAVAEAMACAKPVVTTNCSSLPEIVIDGETGFLCKMDDVQDFVDKIKMLGENKAMREEMGKKGRERIEKYFNLEKMGKEYYEMYQKVIKEFYGKQKS
jgi:glycosyltransferase involved in cell wall biosynthesis